MNYHILFFLIALFICESIVYSQIAPCDVGSGYEDLDVNYVNARILNSGDMWWDLLDEAKYEVPKGSGVNSLFAGGLWIGGLDDGGKLRIAAQTYRQTGSDFWPGPLTDSATTNFQTCGDWDKLWKVNKSDVQQQIANYHNYGNNIPFSFIPLSVRDWPAKGNIFATGKKQVPLNLSATKDMAPFVDVNNDGIYNPIHGDYPNIPGDQAIWRVFNDMGNDHSETNGEKIGLEIHGLAYAFANSNPLGYTTFYHYKIHNYGKHNLDSVYIAQWIDFALGYEFDDYIGCDTSSNLAFVYNGDSIDGPSVINYGAKPPLQGVKILKGPISYSQLSLGMHAFKYYSNGFSYMSNPNTPEEYYLYMKGYWKDGTPQSYGGDGYDPGAPFYPFMYSGVPGKSGWNECSEGFTPFDRRGLMSSGPFPLDKNGIATFDIAAVWADCGPQSGCEADVTCLKASAAYVQAYFDNYIQLNIPNAADPSIFINIFPNPSVGNSILEVKGVAGEYFVEILDLNGRIIDKYRSTEDHSEINSAAKDAGVYFIRILNHNGIIAVKKWVLIN